MLPGSDQQKDMFSHVLGVLIAEVEPQKKLGLPTWMRGTTIELRSRHVYSAQRRVLLKNRTAGYRLEIPN
jgi:hypothetical protein